LKKLVETIHDMSISVSRQTSQGCPKGKATNSLDLSLQQKVPIYKHKKVIEPSLTFENY
jgi:hypothetical protein